MFLGFPGSYEETYNVSIPDCPQFKFLTIRIEYTNNIVSVNLLSGANK